MSRVWTDNQTSRGRSRGSSVNALVCSPLTCLLADGAVRSRRGVGDGRRATGSELPGQAGGASCRGRGLFGRRGLGRGLAATESSRREWFELHLPVLQCDSGRLPRDPVMAFRGAGSAVRLRSRPDPPDRSLGALARDRPGEVGASRRRRTPRRTVDPQTSRRRLGLRYAGCLRGDTDRPTSPLSAPPVGRNPARSAGAAEAELRHSVSMRPADQVWNRACLHPETLTMPGDRALADLLLAHGYAMTAATSRRRGSRTRRGSCSVSRLSLLRPYGGR